MKKAAIFLGVFLLFTSCACAFQMRSGYYVGNGLARSITDVGLQPDLVIIKADTATGRAVWRSSAMSGDSTAYFENAAINEAGLIRSLDSTGFSLGTNAIVNAPNVRYTWTAFKADPSDGYFKVGSYTGNGSDNRGIETGFQPNLVWVKRGDQGGSLGVWYSSAMSADSTHYFSATALTADRIQRFLASSFEVGTNAEVNTAATTYYYFAFKKSPGEFTVEAYSGSGAVRGVTVEGFRPGFVWTKRPDATTSSAIMRGVNLGDNTSQYFTATANGGNTFIRYLNAGSFEVGTAAEVNALNIPYRFAAWKASSTKLAYTQQPTNTTAGSNISPSIKVAVQDVNGNTDTADNSTPIMLSIKNNPGGDFTQTGNNFYFEGNIIVGGDITVDENSTLKLNPTLVDANELTGITSGGSSTESTSLDSSWEEVY